ncbi:MAG: lipopolysaccharide biosynthesis protein [Sulfuritalea sp.]|nr:lipopolysaccharide biosynthesis protein [Sulfuritalea sp.]
MPATLSYFIVRFGNGLLAIATLAVLSRILTPDQYGRYALLIATATVLSSLSFQWLSAAISRFYPQYFENPADIMRAASRYFWLATLGVSLLCLIALAFHEVVEIEPINIALIFLITIALGRYTISLQIANAQHAPMRYCLLSWTKLSAALITSVFFIYFGAAEQGALLGFLLGLGLAIWVFEPHPKMGLSIGMVNARISGELLRFGLPLVINFLAIVLLDFIDRFMIARLLGVAYVASYSIAYDFIQLTIGPFLNIFFLSAFPTIVHLFDARKYEEVNEHLHDFGVKLIGFGVPLAVGVSILSYDIASIMFGLEYQQGAAMLMPWLSAAIFVAVFKSYYLDVIFQLHNVTKYQSYIAGFMVATNMVLNFILLPIYGVIAAAWSTLAAFFLGAVISWLLGKRLFLLPNLNITIAKVLLASFIMGAILFFMLPFEGLPALFIKLFLAIMAYCIMGLTLNIAVVCTFVNSFKRKLIDN